MILPERPEMPGGLNTPKDKMVENIKHNIRLGLPQVHAYPPNPQETVVLVFGGPSLKTNLRALRRLAPKCYVVTVNGSHDYLISEGFKPSGHIMLDARPDNACFVQNPIDTCHYFIASQCDPSVFEALKGYHLEIFHCDLGEETGAVEVLRRYYLNSYHIIIGGSTVGLRSFMLMRTLGFTRFEVFGFDSCFMGNRHHAYEQALNSSDTKEIKVEGLEKTFHCTGWMLRQAYEFQDFVRHAGGLFKCRVHGSGLIATMIKAGAGAKLKET